MKLLESIRRSWLLWVWRHTPNCREMSRLASRSLETPTPFALRLRMRLHHLICAWCQRYERQLRHLHDTAPGLAERPELSTARGLTPEARERMRRRLREANPQS